MSDWLVVGLAILATYRLARMVAKEDGAFNLFKNLRLEIFNRTGNGWLNEGINCPFCLSVWFSGLFATIVVLLLNLSWIYLLLLPLALSAGATLLYIWDSTTWGE